MCPEERGHPCTCNSHFYTASPVPTAQCFLHINAAVTPGVQKQNILSSLPSVLAFSLVVSWLNVSIEEHFNNHTTVYQHHHRAHPVRPSPLCALLSCHSMSLLGKRETGVHIMIFLLLYELQPAKIQLQ